MLRDYLRESCLAEPPGSPQDAVFSWVEIRPLSGSDLFLQALKRIRDTRGTDLAGCGFEHIERPRQC